MWEKRVNENAVEFVSSWKNRTVEQQKKFLKWIAGAFILTAIISVILLSWYQTKNYNRIVEQNMNYIQDSALREANQVEKELNDAVKLINNFANRYASLTKEDETATIKDKLLILSDTALFDSIDFIDTTGLDTSIEYTTNVEDRIYFQKGMLGEKGWDYIESSRITGKAILVFYSPVTVDGEIIGVLTGFYEKSRVEDLFSYEFFNYEPSTYLLLQDGTPIVNSKDESVTENILDKLSQQTFNGENDFEHIKEVIEDDARTTVTFSFSDKGKTSVGVIIQFQSNDWMILSVLPYDVTSAMINNANRAGVVFIVAFAVVLILMSIVFFILFRKQTLRFNAEMATAAESLNASFEQGKEQLSIIESLANIYSSVYYFDLTTDKYERFNERASAVASAIPDTGNSAEQIHTYIEGFVADDYLTQMYDFLDYGTMAERISDKELITAEYRRKDGGWRRGVLIPARRDDNGNAVSVIFAVRAIDADKQKELLAKQALEEAYEAAQVASSAKTTFLSNMSHDIRTPMNAIVGMTAIAAANIDNPEKITDCLKKITSSSKHLLGLINNVLDMSKIESGKIDLNENEFKLSDLIDDMISLNQPLINEKKHTLIVKVNNVSNEDVVGDSTRLQQVFTNLLSNAIKYTPAGGKIEIYVTEKETNKSNVGWYEVIFKDNGIGMSPEFQQTLFEPFSRALDKRLDNVQGTGLGMPIAKNIIRMMNGDITVESELNKGTSFTVSFALKLQEKKEIDFDRFIGLPVLVVDDDISACESTCAILDSLKMDSEWVSSGKAAIAKAEKRHNENNDYYAIIIDWKMPEMNGIETAREIRKRISKEIPIIVISAYNWQDIEQEAKEAGVNAFLNKPIFKSRVVDLFSEFVGKPNEEEKEIIDIDNVHFNGKRILLAEDNEINREIATELLSMMDIEVESAEDGQICVDKFSKSAPNYYDLIFMDIQMPVMNGYDSAVAIRKLSHPNAQSIPIVAMTANAFSTDVRASFDAGMNGHIAKPIDIEKLVKILKQYFA